MSKPDGGCAFPTVIKRSKSVNEPMAIREEYYPGMTLRDWFAGKALPVCWVAIHKEAIGVPRTVSHTEIANEAYRMADAMIAEREKANDFVPKATPYDTSGSRGEPVTPA